MLYDVFWKKAFRWGNSFIGRQEISDKRYFNDITISKGMIMEFTIKEDASTITITVRGPMELNSIKEFQNKVIELGTASPRNVILDIKEVEYIDSTGISVLITLNRQQKQNGKSLIIINASQRVANLLELSSLSDLLQS